MCYFAIATRMHSYSYAIVSHHAYPTQNSSTIKSTGDMKRVS